jgi:hypothetical protein
VLLNDLPKTFCISKKPSFIFIIDCIELTVFCVQRSMEHSFVRGKDIFVKIIQTTLKLRNLLCLVVKDNRVKIKPTSVEFLDQEIKYYTTRRVFRFINTSLFTAEKCCNIERKILIYTYIPLTLYPRRGSRGISDILPRCLRKEILQTWQVVVHRRLITVYLRCECY